ncbi:4-amino-4-deoxy-L-arabinose transferase [Sporobacter termitidis DSM 10068]|uniref:4-amino-4-deoxy-L-arabinose transferase n=1 Tax=Sporobacter termitidis DSM 10068 TaxID=1123282 RepID=A0A1M5YEW1_9FIRM|nr:glycosyltransferase family 39 protein [Sporobacter termitidis]SHI10591.1 4-amino-4-deoxy-L-arabinose transferase [Sporobacter termitidis DSM 10068]
MPVQLKAHRGKLLLLLILLLTAYLTLYKVWTEGLGNAYYTAAVKSMLTSWHNFFFVSFDKGGYISVDKPPLGLWLQCLFALIFGVHGWSVILPEALCAIGSVAVLYCIVKRSWGETCALLASFFMALTPIFIAVSRTNNLDAPLVLVCLLALWALLKAAERGSPGLLVLSMALIGLGFNIKMLQAYMFLPAIYLVYFFTAEIKYSRRVAHLLIATAALLAVSLSWCVAVDLTPAAGRPFVGSSSTNSTLELAIGYNGILRALPVSRETMAGISGAISQVPNEGGPAGLLRFFNREMAGQASWCLPLSAFGLLALFMKVFQKDKTERKRSLPQLLLWGGIFVPMYVYFSISGHIHRYYLIMLVPCLAALCAIAVTELARRFKRAAAGKNSWQNILLPLAFAITAAVQVYMLKTYAIRFSKVLVPVILATAGAAVLLLVTVKLLKKDNRILVGAGLALGVLGILAAPAYWAYTPIQYGTNVIAPFAGPPAISKPAEDPQNDISAYSWGRKWFEGADLSGELISKELATYVKTHDNGARYLIAVPNIMFAAPLVLDDMSVMALGGFIGTDKSISLESFGKLAESGGLQYYLVMPAESGDITRWVMAHGRKVDPASYSKTPKMEFLALYDLSGVRTK